MPVPVADSIGRRIHFPTSQNLSYVAATMKTLLSTILLAKVRPPALSANTALVTALVVKPSIQPIAPISVDCISAVERNRNSLDAVTFPV